MSDNPFESDDIAKSYDAFYENKVGKIIDQLEKRAIDTMLTGLEIKTLLEVGSGTGHWSQWFTDKGIDVTGIEISESMLKVAEAKQIPNARFLHGDGHTFTLQEKFDAVAFITSLEFMQDPMIAIKNAIQHVKPDGILLFGVLNADSWLGTAKNEDPIYCKAKFYTEQELHDHLKYTGKVTLTQCVFSPPPEMMEKSEEEILTADLKTQEINTKSGAFIAGRVQL